MGELSGIFLCLSVACVGAVWLWASRRGPAENITEDIADRYSSFGDPRKWQ